MIDPKDAERLAEPNSGLDRLPYCTMPDGAEPCVGYQDARATITRLREERDDATRRVEALEAEVKRLRQEDEAARHDIERGLANLSSCEAEVDRLTQDRVQHIEQIKTLALSLANTFGERGPDDTAPPAADHTERERNHGPNIVTKG